jgi:hypothetical protein
MLGVVTQHYTPETGTEEIAGWLAAHGGDVTPLLDAARTCLFRTRAAVMLDAISATAPEPAALLWDLRDDPALAPLALKALLDLGELGLDDLTDREQALVMTEMTMELLEMGGPDAVRDAVGAMPARDLDGLLAITKSCGYADNPTLDEFQKIATDLLSTSSGPRRSGGSARRSSHSNRRPRRTRHR